MSQEIQIDKVEKGKLVEKIINLLVGRFGEDPTSYLVGKSLGKTVGLSHEADVAKLVDAQA